MTWLLALLGKEKLLTEVVGLVRDVVQDDNDNRRWTSFDEKMPPEKKMLVVRERNGYYVGYAEIGEKATRIGKYGKFEVANIPERAYGQIYWMEIGDPIGVYNDPENIKDLPESE